MRIAHKTDKGKKHEENEDALLADQERGLFLLADGMGGCQGAVASRIAVQEAYACLKDRILAAGAERAVTGLLGEAIAHAHASVITKSKTGAKRRVMGSTLTILTVQRTMACIGHVGDSRAYLLREEITRLTTDHTLEQCLPNNPMLSELFLFQQCRVPGQAIGVSKKIAHQAVEIDIQRGDILLLCSDGITDILDDEEIADAIRSREDRLQDAAEALINEANARGGSDDMSILLVGI